MRTVQGIKFVLKKRFQPVLKLQQVFKQSVITNGSHKLLNE
jgi:hypothetical protein